MLILGARQRCFHLLKSRVSVLGYLHALLNFLLRELTFRILVLLPGQVATQRHSCFTRHEVVAGSLVGFAADHRVVKRFRHYAKVQQVQVVDSANRYDIPDHRHEDHLYVEHQQHFGLVMFILVVHCIEIEHDPLINRFS